MDNSEHITKQSLEAVVLDHAAEQARRARKPRHKRRPEPRTEHDPDPGG